MLRSPTIPDSAARFTTGGALDTTFDTDGIQSTDMGGADQVYGVAIQADGKAVVAGINGSGNFALARYTTTGGLDTTFGDVSGTECEVRPLKESQKEYPRPRSDDGWPIYILKTVGRAIDWFARNYG